MAILHFTPFSEERICFIEQQDGIAYLRSIEDFLQVLLRLSNIFIDDLAQVDPIQVKL